MPPDLVSEKFGRFTQGDVQLAARFHRRGAQGAPLAVDQRGGGVRLKHHGEVPPPRLQYAGPGVPLRGGAQGAQVFDGGGEGDPVAQNRSRLPTHELAGDDHGGDDRGGRGATAGRGRLGGGEDGGGNERQRGRQQGNHAGDPKPSNPSTPADQTQPPKSKNRKSQR